jgi:sugar O-acyltransferase (sialic acid O-acetyltransferase NeuD family)
VTSADDRKVVIYGKGRHGRVVADMCRGSGRVIAGFIDDDPTGFSVDGLPVLGGRALLQDRGFLREHLFIVGVGDNALRQSLSETIVAAGGQLTTVVHPSAVIATNVGIGEGSVVVAGAVINVGSRLGRDVIVNTGATLDHDNYIEDGVHISPGCHLAGAVTCRRQAFVGTGASIIPDLTIGARAVVAAGATVISDVEPDTLVAGCPAIVKRRYVSPE